MPSGGTVVAVKMAGESIMMRYMSSKSGLPPGVRAEVLPLIELRDPEPATTVAVPGVDPASLPSTKSGPTALVGAPAIVTITTAAAAILVFMFGPP